jgi:Mlc titration factor MtfA (ptsG expression regulator)
MITVIKILIVLFLVVLVIIIAFKRRRSHSVSLPENYKEILNDYVKFYAALSEANQRIFEERVHKFLLTVKISGANAIVEDLDTILIGAGAIIPVFHISDWEYVNLREIILYPGNFNYDFEQHGSDRSVLGMVGTGAMDNVMILSKWELRQGFINSSNNRNTAIHEFVHLVDKMDGTLDGIPEILLERKYVSKWQQLINSTIEEIRTGTSDIDPYGGTNAVECFAVISEYFFEQPELFAINHPGLHEMMKRIFIRE